MLLQEMMGTKEEHGGASVRLPVNPDHDRSWVTLPLVLTQASPPPTNAQLIAPPTVAYDNKTMAIIMGVVVVVFFVSGFVSLYTRQCAHRRTRIRGRIDLTFPMGSPRSTSRAQAHGIDPEIIQSFPTFLYSAVKGRGALACAVCLNEYEDDETLRLIPKCSHVFHPECIEGWLACHSTCPVCRANLLVPAVESESERETPPEPDLVGEGVEIPEAEAEEKGGPSGSRGFMMGILFPRCQTPRGEEEWDRFTLRLHQLNLSSTLKRTKSCVTFTRMGSGRRGYSYRTRSLGNNHPHLPHAYDRFKSPANAPSASPIHG